jgi:hypothetical protein
MKQTIPVILASMLVGASAGGLYDFSVYTVAGKNSTMSVYSGKVVLVVNSAHL